MRTHRIWTTPNETAVLDVRQQNETPRGKQRGIHPNRMKNETIEFCMNAHSKLDGERLRIHQYKNKTPEQNDLLVVMEFMDEVSNGGLHQYLTNSSGDNFGQLKEWYQKEQIAELGNTFEMILDLVGARAIDRLRKERCSCLDNISEEIESLDICVTHLYPTLYKVLLETQKNRETYYTLLDNPIHAPRHPTTT